jgi:hypothetical protein
MKKFLLAGLGLSLAASLVCAVDLTDIPNEAGPYQIKLTVNANNALLEAESDTLVSNVTVQTAAVTATGTVSVVYQYLSLTNVYDSVTNVFLAATNVPTATVTINVIGGGAVTTNVVIQRP